MRIYTPNYYQSLNEEAETIAILRIAPSLRKTDLFSTLSYIGAMLTLPSLQAHCTRLETLALAALCSCKGRKVPTRQTLEHWLNNQLGVTEITHIEDPPQDVFVTNVIDKEHEHLIIPGLWDGIDSSLSLLFESLESYSDEVKCKWTCSANSLLKLSTVLLKRINLHRWAYERSIPKGSITLPKGAFFHELAKCMIFNEYHLNYHGIKPELLDKFCITDDERFDTEISVVKDRSFIEKPIYKNNSGTYVVYLPSCLAYASRMDVFKNIHQDKRLEEVNNTAFIVSSNKIVEAFQRAIKKHEFKFIHSVKAGTVNLAIFESGSGHFICICFINSRNISSYASNNQYYPIEFSDVEEHLINKSLREATDFINQNYEVVSGHIFLLGGHLTNFYLLPNVSDIPNWTCDCELTYSDIITILSLCDYPIEQLINFLIQRSEVNKNSIELVSGSGLFNLFSFWRENNFCLVDDKIPHGIESTFLIGMHYAVKLRREIRTSYDTHITKNIYGRVSTCKRLHVNSIYPYKRSLPIYACLEDANNKIISGYFFYNGVQIWLSSNANSLDNNIYNVTTNLWSGLLTLLHRYFHDHCTNIDLTSSVEVFLSINISKDFPLEQSDIGEFQFEMEKDQNLPRYTIKLDNRIIALFHGSANTGERKIFQAIISKIFNENNLDECGIESDIDNFLDSTAKIIHARKPKNKIDVLISKDNTPAYAIPIECLAHNRMNFFRYFNSYETSYSPSQPGEMVTLLNEGVSNSIEKLVDELNQYDKNLLISSLLRINETFFHSKKIWQGSAQAVAALNGPMAAKATVIDSESTRAQCSVAVRTLIEAAICECNTVGGLNPDGYSLDSLVAQAIVIIEAGGLSDAIHSDLISEGLTIWPNGSYVVCDRNFSHLSACFSNDVHGQTFEQAAETYGYGELLDNDSNFTDDVGQQLGSDFSDAFQAEFGLSINSFLGIFNELVELAYENSNIIITFHKNELVKRCRAIDDPMNSVSAFLDNFSLAPRKTWLPTDDYKFKDVKPWKYGRRLSLSNKPVVKISENDELYIVGIGQLEESICYIISSIKDAKYDKDLFSSKKMRSYIGSRTDKLGHLFTQTVKSELELLGFRSIDEIKMTQLGAPKNPNLGDIDVLSVSDDGIVLIVECKRLRPARTYAEIASTCLSFRGNSGDRLFKHLRRFDWLKRNERSISELFNLPDGLPLKIYAPLVTNIPVPFKYLKDLPIDSNHVISLRGLKNYISSLH